MRDPILSARGVQRDGRWSRRSLLALRLGALCVFVVLPRAVETAPARPDRALYQEARQAEAALKASPRLKARRLEWEKVITRFRRVVSRYPQSSYCDNALMAAGDLYRQMADQFKTPHYGDEAAQAYRAIVEEYPSSSLGDPALYAVWEMARQGSDRKRIAEAGRAYLDAFPDSRRAVEVKTALRKSSPVQAAALPKPPPPGLARVFDLRSWSGENATRVVLYVEKPVPLQQDRVSAPERLWVDLVGTRLHPNLRNRTFLVGDGLLEQVRIGQNRDDVVRVVLDFKEVWEHNVFYLEDPTRLVIDVRGAPSPTKVAQVEANPASAASTPLAAPAPGSPAPSFVPSPVLREPAPSRATPSPSPGASSRRTAASPPPLLASPAPAVQPPTTPLASAPGRIDSMPVRRVAGLQAPPISRGPSRRLEPRAIGPIEGPQVEPRTAPAQSPTRVASRTPELIPPSPPVPNSTGAYSIVRQLGLGARRIVIDAGHGGHDPGTIGRGGLQEKDLVLDVALRLEKLVRSELPGVEVVTTRANDVFVPLEERTAIANSKGADLFLSIHANSSRNPRARGIETYFLNFAVDPQAEEVAARENAISAATLKDLQGLVKAITLNGKINESHDFASSVQQALVQSLKPHYPGAEDRGVHTAPFYVLIGANMPSILAEIAFVSHPEEERVLKSGEYRDRIARSLLLGVRNYLDAVNRNPPAQLTRLIPRATVAGRGGRR